jgi:hypothetical protein
MKIASSFCAAMSCCAFAIRAFRSSSEIATMPDVIGLSAAIDGGTPLVWGGGDAGDAVPASEQPTATAPAPSAAAPRNRRLSIRITPPEASRLTR